MKKLYWLATPIAIALLSACNSQSDKVAQNDTGETVVDDANTPSADIPEGVRAAALAKIPGMTIDEVERKERDGMVFYDVEGKRPDGSEVELDMLEENGSFRVVEVQRDIDWKDVPAPVKAIADATPGMFVPQRVIESIQNDDTVIYELFAPDKPKEPAAEISFKNGKAELLTERWKY